MSAPHGGRLSRLALKELREILRDRRTIVTLLLMPLLVYPLLNLVFDRFLLTSLTLTPQQERVWRISVEPESAALGHHCRIRQGRRPQGRADQPNRGRDRRAPGDCHAALLGRRRRPGSSG